ncbi:MAG: hypothetical protein KatS3mg010_1744 [Acidimicrobiia bacterium]|nr:MAG: hypothetical protein KatS3mg010_1744 [Acidimicrobiia bacterium]
MANSGNDAIARVLRLASYLKGRRSGRVTLEDICQDVPGYEANFDASGELAHDAAWEAVRKKLRRDLKLLDDAFGIECDYDDQSGSYVVRPPFFTGEERDVLVAAAALVRVDGIDDEQLAALGAAVDEQGQRVMMRVHRHVLALREALAARRPVTFRYRGQERVFDPWAVGLWRDRWYTVGWAHDAGDRRVFRLDRIEERADGPPIGSAGEAGSFDPPAQFDAEHALLLDPNVWGQDPPVEARVRVEPDWVQAFLTEFRGSRVESTCDRGSVVCVTVRHYESFRDRLLAFGEHAVLLEPEVLVTQLRVWLEAAAGGA